LKKLKQLDLNKELCYIESRLKIKKEEEMLGKFLMVVSFFIALWAMGLAVVETDFGTRHVGLFTLSTYLVISAIFLYIIGEILNRKERKT
jgi:hypothetical protein